jgi:hypothetical protein
MPLPSPTFPSSIGIRTMTLSFPAVISQVRYFFRHLGSAVTVLPLFYLCLHVLLANVPMSECVKNLTARVCEKKSSHVRFSC